MAGFAEPMALGDLAAPLGFDALFALDDCLPQIAELPRLTGTHHRGGTGRQPRRHPPTEGTSWLEITLAVELHAGVDFG